MNRTEGPQKLASAISELVALRGLARVRGESQLTGIWEQVAPQWSGRTRVLGVKRGVLRIAVGSAPLRSELQSFHRQKLLAALQTAAPHLALKDVKFVLQRNVA